MIKTLHGRLTVIVVALFALSSVLGLLFTSSTTRAYAQEDRQRLNATLASDLARYLAEGKLLPVTDANREKGVKEIKRLMTVNPSIDVYVLNDEGMVSSASPNPGEMVRDDVMLGPIKRLLSTSAMLPIRGTDPLGGEPQVFSVAKAPGGYVYVVLGRQEGTLAQAVAGSYALRLAAGAFAGVAVFSVLSGAYIFWTLTLRMRRLVGKVDRLSTELVGTGTDAAPHGCDEIDGLDHAFDSMAVRLQSLVEALQLADAERRALVENVTHDLRTPIAGLRGYLETVLMRGEALDPAERRDHLQTATRQIDRLSRLIDGMMELARLDSARLEMHPEPFLAAELAQDVLLEFRLRAQEMGIELKLKTDDGSTMIVADIGLVQRALANLVENALRHTPSGGWVEVAAHREPDCVRVSVGDSGPGIAPEDLDRMFERGVRIGEAKDAGGGLGLAIVKRIVELHGAEVRAQSERGVGSRFCMFFPAPRK
ncbi:ATP-binding protein [soil metagenome]